MRLLVFGLTCTAAMPCSLAWAVENKTKQTKKSALVSNLSTPQKKTHKKQMENLNVHVCIHTHTHTHVDDGKPERACMYINTHTYTHVDDGKPERAYMYTHTYTRR
jgi:hypothetical protein